MMETNRNSKKGRVIICIIIVVVFLVLFGIFQIVRGVFWFFGYETPVERYYSVLKTDAALEKKYPGHDFDVREEHGWQSMVIMSLYTERMRPGSSSGCSGLKVKCRTATVKNRISIITERR